MSPSALSARYATVPHEGIHKFASFLMKHDFYTKNK